MKQSVTISFSWEFADPLVHYSIWIRKKWDSFPGMYPMQVSYNFPNWSSFCVGEIALQYRHSIPAPGDRTFASASVSEHPWITCQINNQVHQWPMKIANQSYVQLCHPWIRSSVHTWSGNLVAIGWASVYYSWAVQAFSAGIEWWHCSCIMFTSLGLRCWPFL